jgi:hypothetical protein
MLSWIFDGVRLAMTRWAGDWEAYTIGYWLHSENSNAVSGSAYKRLGSCESDSSTVDAGNYYRLAMDRVGKSPSDLKAFCLVIKFWVGGRSHDDLLSSYCLD